MRVVQAGGYHEPRDAISHDWLRRLGELGLVPVLLPNAVGDPAAYLGAVGVDLLILTGGNDLGPETYGGDPAKPSDAAPIRDQAEFAMLRYAVSRKLPVLGNCRGLQAINVYFGGGLARELDTGLRHGGAEHPVEICEAGMGLVLGADRLTVNSYHRSGILDKHASPVLRVFARVPGDGSIEGLYHPELPIAGVMWHPERPHPARAADARLIQALLRAGKGGTPLTAPR